MKSLSKVQQQPVTWLRRKNNLLIVILFLLGCNVNKSKTGNDKDKKYFFYTEDTVKVSQDFFVLNDFHNEKNEYLFNKCLEAPNNTEIKDANRCTFSKPLNDLGKIKIYQVFSADGLILSDIFLVIYENNVSKVYIPWVKCDENLALNDPCITYEDFEKLLQENSSKKRFAVLKDRLYICLRKNSGQRMRFPIEQ